MFATWLQQRTACAVCGLHFDRGQSDYFIGAYTLNLILALVTLALAIGLGVWIAWPQVRWGWLEAGIVAFLLLFPVLTYPLSKALWLALDLSFRPAEPADFAEPEAEHAADEP